MSKKMIDYFPINQFPIIRPDQANVLNKIDEIIAKGIKIILLEAPTGFGKSAVAVANAKYHGKSYFITGTKELQTQYINDYDFMKKMIGKGNFDCPVLLSTFKRFQCFECKKVGQREWNYGECKHKSAEYAPCIHDPRYSKGACELHVSTKNYAVKNLGADNEEVFLTKPVKKLMLDDITIDVPCESFAQKAIAILSSHSILNYKIYLSYFKRAILYEPKIVVDNTGSVEFDDYEDYGVKRKSTAPAGLGARDLIVFDECHLIETELIDFVGFELSQFWFDFITGSKKKKQSVYLPTDIGENDLNGWLKVLEQFSMDVTAKIDSGTLSDYWKVKLINLKSKVSDTIAKITERPHDWIVSAEKYDRREMTPIKKFKRVKFKPIDLSEYCERLFREDKGNNFLLMTATILDKDMYCKSIGLDASRVEYIQLQSSFPVENRPIYYINGSPYMNKDVWKKEDTLYKWIKIIDQIMTAYKNYKGIIHVSAIYQMEIIRNGVSEANRRRLIETRSEDNDVERDVVLSEHAASKRPSVILSPSMGTGIDLKDDLSRFQIIGKVPYPGIHDMWVKKKMERDPNWYKWVTSLKFVQAYGRSVRSVDDWADTYLIDSVFINFLKNNRFIPRWVSDAFSVGVDINDINKIVEKRNV